MENERKYTLSISVSQDRRDAFDAALLKLKLLRPFDSKSEIIVDAVITAADALDRVRGEDQPTNKRMPALVAA